MVRVTDLDASLRFYRTPWTEGVVSQDVPQGRYTLVFLAPRQMRAPKSSSPTTGTRSLPRRA